MQPTHATETKTPSALERLFATINRTQALQDRLWEVSAPMAEHGELGSDLYTRYHEAYDILQSIKNDLIARVENGE